MVIFTTLVQRFLSFIMEPNKNISDYSECSGNAAWDFGEFREEKVKKEFNCDYFNENSEKDILNHEPELSECVKSLNCFKVKTNFDDPNPSSSQEENEEKFAIKLNTESHFELSDKLSTEQIKSEDNIDIIYEHIKTEISEKEMSDSRIFAICELCHECFTNETDFIDHKSVESKCTSQESNVSNSNNVQDSGLQLHHGIKKETVSKEEITNETASSVVPQKDAFLCKICLKSFKRKGALQVHERIHTGEEKPFQCEICSKSFNHAYNLKIHKKIHTGEKPFHCKVCSKSFNRKDALDVHKRVHTGENPFRCEFCSKSFSQKYRLTDHKMIHTGEKPFCCEICLRSFTRRNHLRVHERIHTGERPYQCEICPKSFNQRINLQAHQKTHTKEIPFHCKICSKSFNRASSFRTHELIHTGEKPFHCKVCSKSFSRKYHLNNHEWIHTGKKPFSCEICWKNFSRRSSLRNHARIHEEGEPFSCNVCLKSFSQSSILKLHEKTHTGETPQVISDVKQENTS